MNIQHFHLTENTFKVEDFLFVEWSKRMSLTRYNKKKSRNRRDFSRKWYKISKSNGLKLDHKVFEED